MASRSSQSLATQDEAVPAFTLTGPLESVACNLCGGTQTTVVAEHDRYDLPVTVVRCVACGLRYLNPRMTAEAYAEFYRAQYRPLVAGLHRRLGLEVQTLAAMEAEQQQYAWELSRIAAPWMRKGQTVLDIGGSTGIVGRTFKRQWGGTVTVIDPAPEELARATGCQTICGTAETVTCPTADVALLCRTIDHLLDPKGVLIRLRAAVRTLIVDALDVDHWPARYRYKVDHPYAFTAATFRALVEAAGWRIDHDWTRRGQKYLGLICSPQE